MGLDRSTMVSVLFAPLRTHRERVCVLVFRRWIVRSGRLNDVQQCNYGRSKRVARTRVLWSGTVLNNAAGLRILVRP